GLSAGVSLAAGGTSWGVISDQHVKKDIEPVDSVDILEKLVAIPISRWRYEWETAEATPHIGPMAQDFKSAFYPGSDGRVITTLEADGVALTAIQGLNRKVEELRAENDALRNELMVIKQALGL
ncbi:MAG TPA: tail fiber domain-containing protein, partial [Kiritimatiellia bacterium]|nr:tail fiber domain-containing protein [Kiritimatiellia bacterium]